MFHNLLFDFRIQTINLKLASRLENFMGNRRRLLDFEFIWIWSLDERSSEA